MVYYAVVLEYHWSEVSFVLNRRNYFESKWSLIQIDGGTVRLPRLIGLSRALDLILTGRTVEADEALNIGLINRIVPDGQSLSAAITLANELLRFPFECMNADRLSAHFAVSNTVDAGLENEYECGRTVIQKESIVGAKHFVELKQGRGGKYDDIK